MLEIDFGMLVITLFTFITLIFILNSWLYRPLIKYMTDRDAEINSDLSQVSRYDESIRALQEKAEQIKDEAKSKASSLKTEAVSEAKALAQNRLDAKNRELANFYETFESELGERRVLLKNELMSQLPLFKKALKVKLNQL